MEFFPLFRFGHPLCRIRILLFSCDDLNAKKSTKSRILACAATLQNFLRSQYKSCNEPFYHYNIPENRARADYPLSGSVPLTLTYKPNNVCNAGGKNKSLNSRGTDCEPAASRIGKTGSLTPLWGTHKESITSRLYHKIL